MEILLQNLNNNASLDTIFILNEILSQEMLSSTIKKEEISFKEARKNIIKFFKNLNNDSETNTLISSFIELSVFSSVIDGAVYEKNSEISKITVPNFDNIFCSSIGVHEYTHALNIKKIYKMNSNIEYEEILPFLNQFLYFEFIKPKYKVDEVINSSKYYMIKEQLYYNLKKILFLIDLLTDNFLTAEDKSKIILKLEAHYKYFIGSLYSLELYDCYNTDEKTFLKKYKKIYKYELTVMDLLNYYKISLQNKKSELLVKKLINKQNLQT